MKVEYAVILCFNQEFSNEVKQIWDTIGYDAIEPHLTLADFKTLDLDEFGVGFSQFFNSINKLKINFHSIGCFLKTNTVYLSPTVTTELWKLHRDFHAQFIPFNLTDNSYYSPDQWVPHCTLKSKVIDEELKDTLTYCIESIRLGVATIETVKLIELNYENSVLVGNRIILSKALQ